MSSTAKLILKTPDEEDQAFELEKSSVSLGRGSANDIVLQDGNISRAHARLDHGPEGYFIVDLGSSNGTVVNGARVKHYKLSPGDVVQLGKSELVFELEVTELEPEVTMINTLADLENTLANATIAMTLHETENSRLVIYSPEKTWEVPLVDEQVTIGRHPDCEIRLPFAKVSRRHASVERQGDAFVVRDLGSGNGTWIDNRAVESHRLRDGEAFRIGSTQLVYKQGFTMDDLTMIHGPFAEKKQRRIPVVFVPGLMGSELWAGSERLWPNVKLMFTDPDKMKLPDSGDLEPRGILNEVVIIPNLVKQDQYNRLGDFLVEGMGYERGVDLLEFAYDWRLDVRESAKRLAKTLAEWDMEPPIVLMAHSLGCLVSRYYVEKLGGKNLVDRLILMGGPHLGVPKAVFNLLQGVDLLPFGLMGERMRKILVTFPSLYQILPVTPCTFDQNGQPIDVMEDASWIAETYHPLLRQAREFRKELGNRSSVPSVSIFGYGLKTIHKINVERGLEGEWKRVNFESDMRGDSTIPEWSTVLKGTEIHPVDQYHGSLFVDNDVKMRLKMELMQRIRDD